MLIRTAVLVLSMVGISRADLFGVRWDRRDQLLSLSHLPVQIRYVTTGVAVVEGAPGAHTELNGAGLELLFADSPPAGEKYFLVDHVDYPLPHGLTPVHVAPAWGVCRVSDARFAAVHDVQHFLWPLPEAYALDAWTLPAVAKLGALAASPEVEQLIAQVDTRRLQSHVEILALIDPAAGSDAPANLRTRYARRPETFESTTYIRDQLAASLGSENVQLHEFRISDDDSLMYNVIGELPGSDPQAGTYIICAHYDAIATRTRGGWNWRTDPAPGADDNASGVALVLENARLLSTLEFPWSIRFIAWSGEELGLWGSRRYATQALERDERLIGVLNFDMIAFNDLRDRIELVTNPRSRWLVDLLQQTNVNYDVGLQIDVLEDVLAVLSDHSTFWARGYDAVLGIENYLPVDSLTAGVQRGDYRVNSQYHSVADVPDSMNWELAARITRLTIATLAQFGRDSGLPNLAVFDGDLVEDPGNDLRVRITNLGPVALESSYSVRVAQCGIDSTDCVFFHEEERPAFLASGAVDDITVPWGDRYGEAVFLIQVDPDDEIVEADEADNSAFQRVRLVPQDDIVVYPNPFEPGRDRFLTFIGLPLFSRVRISTLEGVLMWSGAEEAQGQLTNEVRWPGVNQSGFAVAGGLYVYTIRSSDGQLLRRDKIAVIR